MSTIASIFDIDVPADFVIKRGTHRYKDPQIAGTIKIKNAIESGSINNAKKLISIFRRNNPELNNEMNIANLYLERGDTQKALDVVESIKSSLLKTFTTNKIIENRVTNGTQSHENLGDFYKLPVDVASIITNIPA